MPDSITAHQSAPHSDARHHDIPQLERTFAEEGYLVLRGVVSRSELAKVHQTLTREFDSWRSSPESFRGGGLLSGHLNCYPGEAARGVMNELREAGTFDLANALLPTDPRAVRLGCNFNLPGSVAQHYHMDGIYLEKYLIVNVAVVDTTLENGAIDIVPKTHQRFYRFWEFAAGRVYTKATRVPMSAGDVLIRPSTLWHRGMPNGTSVARPMLAITLGEKHLSTENQFANNDGRILFRTIWFSTSRLGRLRERTTVVAPITYSVYRFAHSLLSDKGYASF
jgi:hypothetical protein